MSGQVGVARIHLDFDGITQMQADTLRLMILMMFQHGVFAVKNGSATLHFGPNGELGAIEVQMLKWRLRSNHQPSQGKGGEK